MFAKLYRGTPRHLRNADSGTHAVDAERGLDPGCPLSVLGFVSVMADVMEETDGELMEMGDAGVKDGVVGYMDDVYLLVKRAVFGPTLAAFKASAAKRLLELQESKSKLWSVLGGRRASQRSSND